MKKKIRSALISVYHKEGLDDVVSELIRQGVTLYSTGGTQKMLESQGALVHSVESLTSYPSILDGRVKTLHPKVFGGLLARREGDHLRQLDELDIPEIDLVVVDLYPFESTAAQTDDESEIIEKIDIGGISLIRAAAKNYRDVVVIPSQAQYGMLKEICTVQEGISTLEQRKGLALKAFSLSASYDAAIAAYFAKSAATFENGNHDVQKTSLRYGENPHQQAAYHGSLQDEFDILSGKALSYNNLVDIDAAIELMRDFESDHTAFAILKHTNSCGVAVRSSTKAAYLAALAGDPLSAFGGILITNGGIDIKTAEEIDKQFYEVLIAPQFDEEALAFLVKKKNRILLKRKEVRPADRKIKSLLGGEIVQDRDSKIEGKGDLMVKTRKKPEEREIDQLLFANRVAKHLKSNTIVLADKMQLLGMGCGQTSRVDACKQAIEKARRMGFDLQGAVMASDAFFPFPDCVQLAHEAGIVSVIQPGGSRNDQLSIDYCDEHGMSMVFTGTRHFKH